GSSLCSNFVRGTGWDDTAWSNGQTLGDEPMKRAIPLASVAGLALAMPAANADDARVGVGVGPVGAGVTVGESDDHDRTTVIKKEPSEHTTVIKKEHEEPDRKVIIHEHDH